MKITKIVFLLLFVLYSNIFANEQKAKEIATLSADSIYDFNYDKLKLILKPFLEKNQAIKALTITDGISGEIILSYYQNNENAVFDKDIPREFFSLTMAASQAKFNDEIVGNINLYYKNKNKKVLLTKQEKEWIKNNPNVTIGMVRKFKPFSFVNGGIHQGYSVDILNKISSLSGLNFNMKLDTWSNIIKSFKDKKIDMISGISHTKDREKFTYFSEAYYEIPTFIFGLKSDIYKNIYSLKNKKLAITKDIFYKEELKKEKIDILEYDSTNKKVKALIVGEVDYFLASYTSGNRALKELSITNIKALGEFDGIKKEDLRYGIDKNSAILYSIIQKSLKQIPSSEFNALTNKWILELKKIDKNHVILSQEEKNWLKQNPINKIAVMSYWPHTSTGDSLHTEILKLINQYAGTNIVPIKFTAWKDGYTRAIKANGLHGIMGLSYSKQREEKYFNYSPAYDFTPSYLITKKYNTSIKSFNDIKDKTIYLKDKSITHQMMDTKAPLTKIIDLKTVQDMYKKLSATDEADAMIAYFIDENELKQYDLRVVEVIYDKSGEVSIGINHKYKELYSIIKKAFDVIPKTELSQLRNKKYTTKKIININFTENEKKWLEKKVAIKYVYDPNWAPFEWTNGLGKHTGIISDILDMISKNTGVKFIPTHTKTWSEAIKLAETKKVDMYSAVIKSEKREKYMNFTAKDIYSYPAVLVKSITNNKDNLIKNESLEGVKIAVVKGNALGEYVRKKYPKAIFVEVAKTKLGLKEIENKTVDLLAINSVIASYFINLQGYSNIKVHKKLDFMFGLKIAIQKTMPKEVLSILNKGLGSINKKQFSEIFDKWTRKTNTLFTDGEKQYLKSKKSIKICTNPNWAPIEFQEENKELGISIDILNTVKENLNVKYEFIKTSSWKESQEFLKDKKCDILPTAIKTEEREKFANFTKPYLRYDLAIITTNNSKIGKSLDKMTDQTMSRKIGSGLIAKIQNQYPAIHIKQTKTVKESFDVVMKGDADFTLSTLPVLLYHKSKYGLKDLTVDGYSPIKYNLSIAVQKDDVVLLNILNKALAVIPKSTYNLVHDKWASVKVTQKIDWVLILQISAILFLIMLFILFNNRKLKSMVEAKTSEITLLLSSFDKNVIASKTDMDGNITYVSEAFCVVSGYREDELIGKSHNIMRHVDTPSETYDSLWKTIRSNQIWRGEIKNRKKDGSFYWVEAVVSPDFDKNNKLIGYSAIRQDITSKKEVEDLSASLEQKVQDRTEELEREKENVEQILANILLPVLITSKSQKTILYANKFAQDLYETSEIDIINAPLDTIYTLSNGADAIIKEIAQTGRVNAREEHITIHTGKEFTGLLSVTPLVHNNEECYIGMTVDITKQKDMENEVREIHKHTRESIEYASLIQGALIPDNQIFRNFFQDYFAIWHPKDIVGGDIYLMNELNENELIIMVIDCTGHGVPGAFVTMLVKAIERQLMADIHKDEDISPAKILSIFNKSIKNLLKQESIDSISNAGFDGGIIYYNKKEKILKFAGAETALVYVDENSKLQTIKGSRHSVGYKKSKADFEFKEHVLHVKEGMQFYCTTDGYLDQNGGEKGFPFGNRKFCEIIEENHHESMAKQQELFLYKMNEYEKMIENNDRNDDMTVIGFKI